MKHQRDNKECCVKCREVEECKETNHKSENTCIYGVHSSDCYLCGSGREKTVDCKKCPCHQKEQKCICKNIGGNAHFKDCPVVGEPDLETLTQSELHPQEPAPDWEERFDKENFLEFHGSDGCNCSVDSKKVKSFIKKTLDEQREKIFKNERHNDFVEWVKKDFKEELLKEINEYKNKCNSVLKGGCETCDALKKVKDIINKLT